MYKIPEKFRITNPMLEKLFGKGDQYSGAFRIPLTEMGKYNSEALFVIASNGRVLPKVGRKSATASFRHKNLIVALMSILGWSAPLLAIHC